MSKKKSKENCHQNISLEILYIENIYHQAQHRKADKGGGFNYKSIK